LKNSSPDAKEVPGRTECPHRAGIFAPCFYLSRGGRDSLLFRAANAQNRRFSLPPAAQTGDRFPAGKIGLGFGRKTR